MLEQKSLAQPGRPQPALWLRFVLVCSLSVAVGSAFFAPLDRFSEDYLSQSFNRALAAFAIARGINAVVSVAQGTELAIQPAGVGVNFAPGEILDPVNDLIERFSWSMLAASSALGVQRVLLSISAWVGLSVLLTASVMLLFYRLARRQWHWQDWTSKLVLAALFIRFAVPVATLSNDMVYRYFLASDYDRANQQLEQTRQRLGQMSEQWQQVEGEADMLERARQWLDQTRRQLSVDEHVAKLQAVAEQATRSTVDMLVVFLMQTVVLPLLFFGLLLQLGRWVMRWPA